MGVLQINEHILSKFVLIIPEDAIGIEKVFRKLSIISSSDDIFQFAKRRGVIAWQFLIFPVLFDNIKVTVAIIPPGGPNIALFIEEYLKTYFQTYNNTHNDIEPVFIRLGTCGGLSEKVRRGDIIISKGSVRLEGTSKNYVIPEFPALSDPKLVVLAEKIVKRFNIRYHIGITSTIDAFYAINRYVRKGRLFSPCFKGFHQSLNDKILEDLKLANVIAIDMETSVLQVLGGIYGIPVVSISSVSDLIPWHPKEPFDFDTAREKIILIGLALIKELLK